MAYVLGTPHPASSIERDRGGLLPPSGAQVQNVQASRVYIFGDGNAVEDEDDDVVEFEMRSRHKTSFPKSHEEAKPDFFEREIRDGETLQAIALKYACNVSDLKRLNNLIQDQEFFALKMVKVPIARHGVLSESKEVQEMSQGARPKTYSTHLNGGAAAAMPDEDSKKDYFYDSESQHDFSDPETQMKVLKTLSIRENFSSQGREAEKFLRKMDADLSKLKTPRGERESLTEVISVLTNKSIRPLDRSVKSNKHNGADCGMSWWSLVIFSLVICIIVPLVYLLYQYLL